MEHRRDQYIYDTPDSRIESHNNELKEWKRSKLLTAWIWFSMIANAFSLIIYTFFPDTILEALPGTAIEAVYLLALASAMSLIGLVLILKNKKLGFWVVMSIGAIAAVFNFVTIDLKTAIYGLFGLLILFILLKRGGTQSAWNRLK